MRTSTQYRGILLVVLGSALISGSAQAQDQNTYLYIAHAASGRAVSSTANPALPIDISVNGICLAQGISYGEIRGPYSGPAGTYNFQASTANAAVPCGGAILFTAAAPLSPANTLIGVLSLDSANHLTGLLFAADLTPVAAGQARVEVINGTQETLSANINSVDGTTNGSLEIPASTLKETPVVPTIYRSVIVDSTGTVETGPITAEFAQRNLYIYVLAGSVSNQSVQVIGPKAIRGVF